MQTLRQWDRFSDQIPSVCLKSTCSSSEPRLERGLRASGLVDADADGRAVGATNVEAAVAVQRLGLL
eukprot:10246385-Lingulodinium_polyedra.AAC.1